MKICSKCKLPKEVNEFYKNIRAKDGLTSQCKQCIKEYQQSDAGKAVQREYNQSDAGKAVKRKYQNSEEYKATRNARRRKRRQEDPAYKLQENLRCRLWDALTNYDVTKSARTIEYAGCTVAFMINHLEAQFTEGMNWDNMGDWHLDHILPVASFNLKNENEMYACFNWRNLKPLWEKDNREKSDKYCEKEWDRYMKYFNAHNEIIKSINRLGEDI